MNPRPTPLIFGLAAAVYLLRAPGGTPSPAPAAAGPAAVSALMAPVSAEGGAEATAASRAAEIAAPPAGAASTPAAWSHYARLFREELDIAPPAPLHPLAVKVSGRLATQTVNLDISARIPEEQVGDAELHAIAARADAAGDRLEFMIALVADPVDSRLAADFDLSLHALQAAVTKAEYRLERLWLPWAEPDAAERKSHHDAAGMLLFRRDPPRPPASAPLCPSPPPPAACDVLPEPGAGSGGSLLAVFLVGETPKLGIHKPAFHHAVEFIFELGARSRSRLRPPCTLPLPLPEIPVLGPTYSGSADSLRMVFEKHPAVRFRVVSGSATAPEVESHLIHKKSELASRVWFSRTVMLDGKLAGRAFRFLRDRLEWRLDHAALLIESDTVYGAHFLREPDKDIPREVKRIAFPSNLLALRNAWQQSAFGPPAAEAAKAPKAAASPKTALEVSLTDQGTPIDLVPELSPLTPRLGDMALSNLLRQLARERTDYVGILATDVKDELFLAEQIRRWMPNVVLFVFDSNLLYVHPQYSATMFGALAIASFPLTTEGPIPELSPAEFDPRYRRQFASAWHEGTYLAVRTLLGEPACEPAAEPAAWISASGNYAMWPLAKLPPAPGAPTAARQEPPAGYGPVEPLGPLSRKRGLPRGEAPPEESDQALLFLLALLWLPSYFLWRGAFRRAAIQIRTRYLFSGAAALLCLAGAGVVELWIGRLLSLSADLAAWSFLLVLLAAYGVLVWVLLATARLYYRPRPFVAVFLLTGLSLPWLLWAIFTFGLAGGNAFDLHSLRAADGIAFYLRARAFAGGLSPFVSLAWITAAAFFWVALELKRHLVLARHRTAWPLHYDPEPALAGCQDDALKLEALLDRTWPSGPQRRLAMLSIVAAPTAFLWIRLQPIGESRGYGRAVLVLVVLVSLLGLASFFRFFSAWAAARRLLQRVKLSKLLPALERVAGTIGWQPTRFGWYGTSFTPLKQAVERLQALIDLKVLPPHPGPESLSELLRAVLEAHGNRQFATEIAARRELEHRFAWAYPRLAGESLGAVEDFFAVRLIAYLRHVFNQLRYAVMGQFGTGLALMAAIATYAFEPKRATTLIVWVVLMSVSAVALGIFVQMDRDATLSAIGGTPAGKVTYDWAFLSNVLTYAVLPVLGLAASQFPGMGRLFSSLVDPLARLLGTG